MHWWIFTHQNVLRVQLCCYFCLSFSFISTFEIHLGIITVMCSLPSTCLFLLVFNGIHSYLSITQADTMLTTDFTATWVSGADKEKCYFLSLRKNRLSNWSCSTLRKPSFCIHPVHFPRVLPMWSVQKICCFFNGFFLGPFQILPPSFMKTGPVVFI